MRNLKKFLALVMAMVMAFSLMVSANAASKYDQVKEWTDKDQVTEEFVEAVDVLSGMKVFQGDEDGFRPGSTITRAETAALIYRLATGDVENVRTGLYANYGNFADVAESDWFAGYVGYCANAGYIKGHGGYFNPYDSVTGYEALAMILRAVGYDKNHEFEGATWQTNVSALGTRLGVLDDVKTSDYANTLHLPSRRDVVASILFACAQLDTVTYTPALGYETGSFAGDKTSLGVKNFGLAKTEGIIVGNQDTGESMTRINKVKTVDGKAVAPDYYAYFHQTKNYNVWNNDSTVSKRVEETTVSTTIDAKTGVEMFGHKVKAWYADSNTTGAAKGKTFALYDNVKKTALVTPGLNNAGVTNADISSAAGGTPFLGRAVAAAGFNVDLVNSRTVFNKDFGISGVRLPVDGENDTDGWVTDDGAGNALYVSDYVATGNYAKAGTMNLDDCQSDTMLGTQGSTTSAADQTKYPLYLVVSNNDALTPDMIIAVNANVSRIVQENNYATHKTVTVPQTSYDGTATDFNADGSNRIAQAALTATSDKALNTPVVAINIAGTKVSDNTIALGANGYTRLNGYTQPANSPLYTPGETALFRLSKPTQVVEGLVTAYKGSKVDPTNDYTGDFSTVNHTGSIVINGQTIERSLLADAIVSYNTDTSVGQNPDTGAQIKAVNLAREPQTYQNYRAYLDSEGKYIWVEPISDRTFLYGTYIDYTTPYTSSAYEYTVVGVNDKGEQVKEVVKTFNGDPIDRTNYSLIGQIADQGLPFRDSGSLSGIGGVAGVTPNLYGGLTLGSNGDLLTNVGTLGWTWADHTAATALSGTGATDTTIDRTDVKVGMAETGKATAVSDNYFLTESSKIIAVSGAGTDTQKVKVFNGITELLDGAVSVTIKNGVTTQIVNKGVISDQGISDGTSDNLMYSDMMYYTSSNFTYASNVSRAKQIDTLILPMDALQWQGKSNLYFIGNNEKTSEIQVGTNWFTQFTMYKDGEAQNIWVEGRDNEVTGEGKDSGGTYYTSAATIGREGTAGATNNDSFFELALTDKTLPDGTPVYMIEGRQVNAANGTPVSIAAYDANGRPDTANEAPVIWGATYWAATYAAQTAMINPDVDDAPTNAGIATGFSSGATDAATASYNVAGAKVVNLNAADSPYGAQLTSAGTNSGYIWNGITDLGTLNDAASTSAIYAGNRQPVVSCLVDPANPLNVTVIYVHWSQEVQLTPIAP